MLSEEKKSKRNWSMLMPSQNIMLLLYSVMSKCGYPVSAYSNINVNDVTIKIIKIQELSSPKVE